MGVGDEKSLEGKLQGIKYRNVILNINLSKHRRQPVKKTSHPQTQHQAGGPPPPPLHPLNGWRDRRTFAQVISNTAATLVQSTATINLNSQTCMKE
ncbi:unnamed protein product [Lactuca virosa]|uniref:Uncharacterized protein n=1 Tax=Lactuca virosa TaxID=75947 RepID=A0AAU9M5X6_9ASTR|nr:unnamed protein product [Lactuca virosa]